jgi:hypothetical protein
VLEFKANMILLQIEVFKITCFFKKNGAEGGCKAIGICPFFGFPNKMKEKIINSDQRNLNQSN